MRCVLKIVVVTSVAAMVACGGEDRPLNVVLIGVDTLRPDHLGCYGYDRHTSPNIDRLAEEGILYRNAVSQCPWTLPSFATVLTSLYPSQHGAGWPLNSMRTGFPTLASILAENGYATGAVINVSVLSRGFGVDRGFEYYDVAYAEETRTADKVTEDALSWIDLNRERPFFIFVHYFDPHLSYTPPAPYDTLFDPGYVGRVGGGFGSDDFRRLQPVLFGEQDPEAEADWNHIRALYDGEIAFTDDAIGNLLRGLEGRGLREKTLIVFLSDHGEEFFEHRGFGHGHTLYNEVIRVPLIISLPSALPGGRDVGRQVRLVDVMPTILDVLNLDVDSHLEGVSVLPFLKGKRTLEPAEGNLFPPEIAYSEGNIRGPDKKGITAYPWKLIYDVPNDAQVLFDLENDPRETASLSAQGLEVGESLESMLFKSWFVLSDTWYVELAGDGQAHVFDLKIAAERGHGIGNIYMHRLLDDRGHLIDVAEDGRVSKSGSTLEITGLELKGRLTVAFKAEVPKGMPITFDLRLDGKPAVEETFIGRRLTHPPHMPFAERGRRARAESGAGPADRPRPPYYRVWYSEPTYKGEVKAKLDETTKQDLRALGYIQ
jgi:arylsulfatase A-like enzyme